jgi:uncharacterized protein YqeY
MRTQVENLKTITNSETSTREIEILNEYLPSMMNDSDIEKIITEIIPTINNIGAIMGYFSKNYKGLVDNKRVSEIYKNLNVKS